MGKRAADNRYTDALERAGRTLWQGIVVDALIAVGTGLLILLEGADVSSPVFWAGVGALVIKSFLVSAASYLARLKLTPKESPDATVVH